MALILRTQSYRKQAPATPLECRFDRRGGSIGRAAGNDLELPDPGKYISRNHSKIDFADGRYVLMDLGSNPSWVNERPLGGGKSAVLADGDRLLIGDYVLEVEIGEAPGAVVPLFAPESSPGLPFQAQPAAAPSPHAAPAFELEPDELALADILDIDGGAAPRSGVSADDPLGLNLLAPAALTPAAPGPAPFRGSESDHLAPQFAPMDGAAFAGATIPAAKAVPAISAAPFVPAAPASAPTPAPGSGSRMLIPDDYDPLADLLAPRAPAPAPFPAPPTAYSPAPLAAPAAQPAVPGAGADHDAALLQALLRGLGVPGVRPARSALETAELVGAMLREAVGGTMAVLQARSMTKRESRLDMTVLGAQANNPLKFFPDAEGALAQMLTNAMAGYMPPLKSIGSAFEDLKAHELAVIAGMRAALAGVMGRFNPALVEARMEPAGVMDKMLQAGRKARMWDQMVALYAELQREADDDFQQLFGERFSAAYEEQIERLQKGK